ncbi:hypothetical protein HNY73_015543 [Argiope bruennichi]|uniref:Uncharacterized protein n=1 Tax=Argiope bruennichi TaxID=94029 RepID=A0A8T0ETV5_ARGBR|nr:hypothetical protein HNY73_015543 [Argiope bruennichi]
MTTEDAERLLSSYTSAKSVVASVDDESSLLVFLFLAITSLSTYVSLSSVLKPPTTIPQVMTHICSLTPTFGLCMAIFISAASVSEASFEIADKAETNFGNANASKFLQLKFLMSAEKEISMTVWKITTINRSLIFAIIGTMFTYAMLLESL